MKARDSLADAEWEEIANAIQKVDSGLTGPKTRKLRTRIGMVKILLSQQLLTLNGTNSIDMSLFISSFKTTERIEREFETHRIKKREFLVVLRLLLSKMKKQKLKVKKPLEVIGEFGKMKGVVENGRHTL